MNQPEAPESSKTTGKFMLWVFWLIVLVMLSLFFGNIERKQYNPNTAPDSNSASDTHTVKLKRNRYGHYVSSGFIKNKPVVFMLDTGASSVALPQGLATKLGLRRGIAMQVQTANGITTAYQTVIPELRIGSITLHDVAASIVPNMEGEEILLGMSALKQLDFNQSGNILTLVQHRF